MQSISGRLPERGRKRRERIDESKNVQTTPTRTYCKRSRPLPYCNPNCRTPRHWKFFQHHRTTRPGGAKVLGKLSVPGRPTSLDDSRTRAFCACSRCGWGLFGHFFPHLSFLFSFSLSLGDGPILTEILSQRAVKPKTTNQPWWPIAFPLPAAENDDIRNSTVNQQKQPS